MSQIIYWLLVLLPLRPLTFNTKFCSVPCGSTLQRDQWEGLCDVPLHAKWNFIRMNTHYLGSVIFLPFNAHGGWTTEPQLFNPYGRKSPPKNTTSHPMPKYEAYVCFPTSNKKQGGNQFNNTGILTWHVCLHITFLHCFVLLLLKYGRKKGLWKILACIFLHCCIWSPWRGRYGLHQLPPGHGFPL